MKIYHHPNDLVPCLLIAKNMYGILHLYIKVNKRPTEKEAIEIMKKRDYWMEEDEIEIVFGMNEPFLVIL